MVYEGVVPSELCDGVLGSLQEENYQPGTVGGSDRKINKKVRNVDHQWQDRNSLLDCILTRFMIDANLEALWNFDITQPELVQISRYNENQFYGQHIDCHVTGNQEIPTGLNSSITIPLLSQRKISASLLLSKEDDYDGGDLIILSDTIYTKKQGTIIVFPSFMAHQVTPVTKGVRYSAVCWMGGPKWK